MDCSCKVYTSLEEKLCRNRLAKMIKKRRERVYKILESFNTSRPEFYIEGGKYFAESIKEIEGEKMILRWAKAMMHTAKI